MSVRKNPEASCREAPTSDEIMARLGWTARRRSTSSRDPFATSRMKSRKDDFGDSRTSGTSSALLRQEATVVGRRRLVTELPQEECDLPPMISRVVENVLHQLAQRVGIGLHGSRRIKLRLRQAAQVSRIRVLVTGP